MTVPIRENDRVSKALLTAFRIFAVIVCFTAFVPALNPARLSGLINKNASLFTCAVSYSSIGSNFVRALTQGWVEQSTLTVTYIGALTEGIAIMLFAAAACMSIGNMRLRRLGVKLAAVGSAVGLAGAAVLRFAAGKMAETPRPERVEPILPDGIAIYFVIFSAALIFSILMWVILPEAEESEAFAMEPQYRLFLMILPFLILVALFAYLPLWGWRYAFYDYRPGFDLKSEDFVWFKWFKYLFSNAATRADIIRVLKNTFAMSGIGLITSWLPMAFAIFLSEMRRQKSRRMVQTLTTIPNFISWVLVYSVAFAIFSTEGLFNWVLSNFNMGGGVNHLMGGDNIWLKMWLWGTWKGLGWGAIIYIAGISGIDQQLYEAATVDGAGRFRRMWHITVPGLMSTFFVLLLLSIANILSNGLDQYLAFYNHSNKGPIQVLDLYIYQLGIGSGTSNSIPLATAIGMFKSVISVTLLFAANKASKMLRGESIV